MGDVANEVETVGMLNNFFFNLDVKLNPMYIKDRYKLFNIFKLVGNRFAILKV